MQFASKTLFNIDKPVISQILEMSITLTDSMISIDVKHYYPLLNCAHCDFVNFGVEYNIYLITKP